MTRTWTLIVLCVALAAVAVSQVAAQFAGVKDLARQAVGKANADSAAKSDSPVPDPSKDKAAQAKQAAAAKAAPKTQPAAKAPPEGYWIEPMKQVHAKFTGTKGTFAHFGDSITISQAFWTSLKESHKNMDAQTQAAFDLVNGHMLADCWGKWKGGSYGNDGGQTIRWADKNVEAWLKKLNPEAALIMFGTNDLNGLGVEEYEAKTRQVVQKCLDNGTVVILSTIPPRHGRDEKVKTFVEAVRKVAAEMKVPLCDYYKAVTDRRPDDWSGKDDKFKDVPGGTYDVPTLISRDGVHPSNPNQWASDYSVEGLKHNGYVLRNYVALTSYAEVLKKVVKAEKANHE